MVAEAYTHQESLRARDSLGALLSLRQIDFSSRQKNPFVRVFAAKHGPFDE